MFRPSSIFTPGAFPEHTYIQREADEHKLSMALETPGIVTSISGPTKTGKSVLVHQVVGSQRLVAVSGSTVETADDVWRLAGEQNGLGNFEPNEVIQAFIDDGKVLVIDDFHYVARSAQRRIAQQIKDAVSRGLPVIVVAIPHRADDAVRANPDLRGRVLSIDLDYWAVDQLVEIGRKGFPLLNVEVTEETLRRLADESLRAPQIMQHLCLQTCHFCGIREVQQERPLLSLTDEQIVAVARAVASFATSDTVYQILRQGPPVRGQPRAAHPLRGGGTGDIYEVVLRALKRNPPALSFPITELKERVARVVAGSEALGGSVQNTVRHMDELLKERIPDERVLEWDEVRQTVDIVDPYFAYYLRWGTD